MNEAITSAQNRLPAGGELISVFSFIAFLVYGRMLFVFAWKLPSWLMFLTGKEILAILSYSVFVSLLESAGYGLVFSLVAFLLPGKWFRDQFVTRSVWALSVWFLSLLIYFTRLSNSKIADTLLSQPTLFAWLAVTLTVVILIVFLAGRMSFMRKAALWFAEQSIVFLFLLVPASLAGMVVVIIRNLS